MKKIIIIFIIVFTCYLPAFAMQAPIMNQVTDYSPIAEPIIADKHETAFPLGLGVAADNGDKLDLIIGLENFTAAVDLYLGLYAPELDPNDIYLFTESGNIQGLKTAGLQPWKHKLTESISTTVLSNIPTNSLPYGTYTFYLLVTPADTLEPQWLWSTAFQHSDAIKGIFINTVREDELVMTAVDKNDLYYSFFAEKNEAGEMLYYHKMVIDQRDSNGDFEHYLSIDFDPYGRPVILTIADSGSQILLEYVSATQVSISINENGHLSDTFNINNPYSGPDLSVENRKIQYRSSTLENNWLVTGEIKTCKNDSPPKVTIKPHLDEDILKAEPQLALIKAKVFQTDVSSSDFSYSYRLQGLPDYDSWYYSCAWNYAGVLAGPVIGLFDTAAQLLSNMASDITGGTITKTGSQVVDHFGDKAIPVFSFVRKLNAMNNLPIDEKNGPCSYKIWRYLNQVQTADNTVSVSLNKVKKVAAYTPKPEQLSEFLTVVDAPDFDFSDSCEKTELSCNNQCSGIVVEIDYSCATPEGAVYKEFLSTTSWSKYFLLNKQQVGSSELWLTRDDGSLYLSSKTCRNESGQLDGWDIRYYETGEMNLATHYKNDQKDGHQYDFYYELDARGSLYVDNAFINGENTTREIWYEDGTKKKFCDYTTEDEVPCVWFN